METNTVPSTHFQSPRRALVEILPGGELKVFPIADSDEQAAEIMDALRFLREDRAA